MTKALIVAFLVVLAGLTLLALRMWYTKRGADVSEDERRLFRRFLLGLAILWLVVVAGYFGGPYLFNVPALPRTILGDRVRLGGRSSG